MNFGDATMLLHLQSESALHVSPTISRSSSSLSCAAASALLLLLLEDEEDDEEDDAEDDEEDAAVAAYSSASMIRTSSSSSSSSSMHWSSSSSLETRLMVMGAEAGFAAAFPFLANEAEPATMPRLRDMPPESTSNSNGKLLLRSLAALPACLPACLPALPQPRDRVHGTLETCSSSRGTQVAAIGVNGRNRA